MVENENNSSYPDKKGVIFVLESACLELSKIGKSLRLLNCDDHATILRRKKKHPSHYRPDICHQALLTILDSPLNKAGKIAKIIIHTKKNLLIELKPCVKLPRTFQRFCGLMTQLLHNLSIKSTSGSLKLLRVIKGPITKHFPVGCIKVGFSRESSNPFSFTSFVRTLSDDSQVVLVVGALAHGTIDLAYVETLFSVSQYSLSASYCISRITNAFEHKWNII